MSDINVNYRWTNGYDTNDQWPINFIGAFDGASPTPDPRDSIIFVDGSTNTPAQAIANLTNSVHPDFDAIVQADPKFTNYSGGDYTLASDSTLRDAGVPLTTVATADTSSGTSLILDDAKYFSDGRGIVDADYIAVGTVSNTVQITAVDYDNDTVTLASGISREDGDDVWLYKISDGTVVLNGSGPDIGAFEYASETGSVAPPSPPTGLQIVQ
jgi:hypothetical protein